MNMAIRQNLSVLERCGSDKKKFVTSFLIRKFKHGFDFAAKKFAERGGPAGGGLKLTSDNGGR